ncbi:MAG: HlyD family efflux transporter periplasmic adaptor subunit [Pseudomonadota bacterium]
MTVLGAITPAQAEPATPAGGAPRLPTPVRRLIWGAALTVLTFVGFVVVWAILAPVSTTIRVGGVLSPSAPSFEVQHDAGGQIAAVHVALHDEVPAGAHLLTLDTRDLLSEARAVADEIARGEAELREIARRLTTPPGEGDVEPADVVTDAAAQVVAARYAAQDAVIAARIADARAQQRANDRRVTDLAREATTEDNRAALVAARLVRARDLRARDLMSQSDFEALEQAALQAQSAQLALVSRKRELTEQSEALDRQISRLWIEQAGAMAERQLTLQASLATARARRDQLDRRIEGARVLAPVSGKVTDMAVATPGMVVAPRTTLLTLTQPVDVPRFDLFIPPAAIDQVRVGQSGLLTVNALPQRDAPRIVLTLTDIAREPVRDRDGNSLHYRAVGEVTPEALAAARAAMGSRFQLQVGMPINVALEGHSTTLWTFVTGPFTGLLSTAFED